MSAKKNESGFDLYNCQPIIKQNFIKFIEFT